MNPYVDRIEMKIVALRMTRDCAEPFDKTWIKAVDKINEQKQLLHVLDAVDKPHKMKGSDRRWYQWMSKL
jgi:hypothetical protein